MLSNNRIDRIKRDAKVVCRPYGIGLHAVEFVSNKREGASIDVVLPEGVERSSPVVIEAIAKLKDIPGTESVRIICPTALNEASTQAKRAIMSLRPESSLLSPSLTGPRSKSRRLPTEPIRTSRKI
jgi:hypothetical protein